MKTCFFVCISMTLLFLTSCKKEDEDSVDAGRSGQFIEIKDDQINEIALGPASNSEFNSIGTSVINSDGSIYLGGGYLISNSWENYLVMANHTEGLLCKKKVEEDATAYFIINDNEADELYTSYGSSYDGKTLRRFSALNCNTFWEFEYEDIVKETYTAPDQIVSGMPVNYGKELLIPGVLEKPNNNFNTWILRLNEFDQVIQKKLIQNSLLKFWEVNGSMHMVGQKDFPDHTTERLYVLDIDLETLEITKEKDMAVTNNYGVHKLITNDYGFFFSVGWPRSNHLSFSKYDYEGKRIYNQNTLMLSASESDQHVFDSGRGGLIAVGSLKDSTQFIVQEIGGWSGQVESTWKFSNLNAKIMSIDNARILPNGTLIILCTYEKGDDRKIGFYKTKI